MSAPYVVRDRRGFAALMAATALSVVVAAVLALVTGQWVTTGLAVVVVGYLALVRLRRTAVVRLRVDAAGIAVSAEEPRLRPGTRRYVPWSAVREVEVDGDLLVVLLHSAHPDEAGEVRERVPGIDGAALRQAVAGLGVTVPVVLR